MIKVSLRNYVPYFTYKINYKLLTNTFCKYLLDIEYVYFNFMLSMVI